MSPAPDPRRVQQRRVFFNWKRALAHQCLVLLVAALGALLLHLGDGEAWWAGILLIGLALYLGWLMLTAMLRATWAGQVLRISPRGLELAGEPCIDWHDILHLHIERVPERSPDRRGVLLRLVLRPGAREARASAWAWVWGPAHRCPAGSNSPLEVDGSTWAIRPHQLAGLMRGLARRYAPHFTEQWFPAGTLSLDMSPGRRPLSDEERDMIEARDAAVQLIHQGRKASDPDLRAAWAKADALRKRIERP